MFSGGIFYSQKKELIMSNSYDAFCKLMHTDDDLKYLGDIASCGKLQSKKYIADYSNLQIHDAYYDATQYLCIPGSSSWIRFVTMNTKFFTTFKYIWDNDSSILIDREHGFSILGDSRYGTTHEEILDKCINININCETSGSVLNLLNLMRTCNTSGGENDWFSVKSSIRAFHKILTISNKNYIVGIIDNHGILWLNKNLLDKILEQNGENEFNQISKNALNVFSAFHICMTNRSVDHYLYNSKKDILKSLFEDNFINSISQELGTRQDLFDIFSVLGLTKEDIANSISELVKSVFRREMTSNQEVFWGKNGKYSFRKILDDYIWRHSSVERNMASYYFHKGMNVGRQFENYGWTVADPKEILYYDSPDIILWKKSVNLVPKFFVYKTNMYSVSDEMIDNSPFRISTLYINSHGVMYAEGRHPNVSRQKVCMGDLKGKLNISDCDPDTLKELLLKVETLLLTINYDSAYTQDHVHEYLDKSTKVDFSKKDDSDIHTGYVPQGDSVFAEVQWVTDDDLEEDDESDSLTVVDQSQEITSVTQSEQDLISRQEVAWYDAIQPGQDLIASQEASSYTSYISSSH